MRQGRIAIGIAAALCLGVPARAQEPGGLSGSTLDSLLDTRISTAAKYEQTIDEVAGAVTLVTADDIERYGYRTLADVFAGVRGFYLSNDRNYTYLGTRGFSRPTDYNNRVLLLLDGQTLNENVWGGAQIGSELGVDLGSLERIEIIRGPGSALYGTGAMFAVVNLITKTGSAIDGVRVAGRTGSYGLRGASALYGRRFTSGLDLSLSGVWEGTDGQNLFYPEYDSPTTNGGIAHHLDWEHRWGLQSAVRRGEWRLRGYVASRTKAIPTGAFDATFDAPSSSRDDIRQVELRVDHPLSARARLMGRTYYTGYWYSGQYAGSGEGSTDAGQSDGIGGEGSLQWDLASSNRLTVGGEYRRILRARYFYPRSGPTAYDLDVPHGVASVYVQDEHQLTPRLSVLAGLRRDDYTTTGSATAPRAAVIVAPARGTTVKLLYGRAFRAPSVTESYQDDRFIRGNPDLRAEQGRTLELIGQRRFGSRLLGTVSLFTYAVDGLIDLTVDSAGVSQYRNVGDADATGVEVGLDARLGAGLSGYANYTYQRARDRSTHQTLTNSPAHLAKSGAEYRLRSGLLTGLELRYESGRRTVYGTSTDPFLLATLTLTATPRVLQRSHATERLTLALRVANLFDASYATPGGVEHRQPAIPQDGRSVLAELRYRF